MFSISFFPQSSLHVNFKIVDTRLSIHYILLVIRVFGLKLKLLAMVKI